MKKIVALLLAPWLVAVSHAERIEIPKALFSLDLPAHEYWQVLPESKFPDAVASMCFPRFRRGGTTLSAGLWEYPYSSVESQIAAYFDRMNRYASDSYTRELDRTTYYAKSGLMITRLLVETGKVGGEHWQLVRYIFRNRAGIYVCLSAAGDFTVTDKAIFDTIQLMNTN